LKKYSYIKFDENLFSGSRLVPCERTDRRAKLIDTFFLILRTRLKVMFTTVPIMTRVFVTG